MLKPSHIPTFTAAWTSCLPAIPANRSARQDKEKAKPTSDISGHSLQEELPLVSPDLCSPKTSKDTCPLGLRTFSKTWAEWVTSTRQDYLARRKSAQATEGNGCFGWPTPAAHEARLGFQNRNNGKKGSQKSLTTIVVEVGQQDQAKANTNGRNPERWATPEAQNQTGYQTKNGQVFPRLGTQAKWPTPASGTSSGGPHGLDGGSGARSMLPPEMKQSSGKLNPNWVEQLMGLDVGRTQLPTEWTDSDSSATESSRKQQRKHG